MRSAFLVTPDESMEIAALEFVQEFLEHFETTVYGCCSLETGRYSYCEWLSMLRQCACAATKQIGSFASETYFAMSEQGRILGVVTINPISAENSFLQSNICFSVRPTERRKGFGSEILRQAIRIARERGLQEAILLYKKNNRKNNEAVKRTILQSSGISERTFKHEETIYEQYRIDL